MRNIIFGDFDSWSDWGLTLTGQTFSAPTYKPSFVSVPGRDGDLDLSGALTDGEPRYENRQLTTTFEISSGTRSSREALFSTIMNALDGRIMNIVLPDDPYHYITGRLQVAVNYNDLAHGAITITANCEPWRQASAEVSRTLTAISVQTSAILANSGRRQLIPTIIISGASASVELVFGASTWELTAGTYQLPGLLLRTGNNELKYRGSGTINITYREAIL